MNKAKGLSVVITVKNEEDNIVRCLESIKWAEEIIIVDNGSTCENMKRAYHVAAF